MRARASLAVLVGAHPCGEYVSGNTRYRRVRYTVIASPYVYKLFPGLDLWKIYSRKVDSEMLIRCRYGKLIGISVNKRR